VPKPDFFIAGAPKCGTSALYTYLERHPDVFMSQRKEPMFFCDDLNIREGWRVSDPAAYLAMFDEGAGKKRIGEATTYYMISRKAAANIRAFNPEARIILMVRNPVDMAHSLHREMLWNCNEDIEDFAQAIDAEDDRRQGRRLGRDVHFVGGLLYTEMADFEPQIRRYFDAFGRERVKVIVFDDFVKDTPAIFADTLRFLGLDDGFQTQFERVNPSKPLKARFVQRLYIRFPVVRRAVQAVVSPRRRQQFVTRILPRLGGKDSDRAPLDPAVRERLNQRMRPAVERLSELLGRDLTHWVAPRPTAAAAIG